MFRRMLLGVLLVCALGGPARAAPFWVAWEGNDFPEKEGWTRFISGDGPATRTLENGVMTIDSLRSLQISDFYRIDRSVNPSSGEMFVMEWRLRVNEVIDNDPFPFDPSVGVFSDDAWGLGFEFGEDGFRSVFEDDVHFSFEPGLFHYYQVRSADMRTYQLFLDGDLVRNGTFYEAAVSSSRVGWGDGIRGAASSADWDYFRFGVVPEPSSGVILMTLVCVFRTATLKRRMR